MKRRRERKRIEWKSKTFTSICVSIRVFLKIVYVHTKRILHSICRWTKGLDARVRLFNRFRIFKGPRDIVLLKLPVGPSSTTPALKTYHIYDSTSAKPLSNFFFNISLVIYMRQSKGTRFVEEGRYVDAGTFLFISMMIRNTLAFFFK